ncbi:MAG: VOC family protein [Ilumatobacteraceae bacterium]
MTAPRLDHLVLATTDLAGTTAAIGEAIGITPSQGGRHVGVGTANTLLSFGDGSYLEVIGPDPTQGDVTAARPFGIDGLGDDARLVTFALRVDGIDAVIARARSIGHDPGDARAMQRATPDGGLLSWKLTSPPAWAGGALPFLIDWGDTTHPSTTSAGGASLSGFGIGHPEPSRIDEVLATLGFDAPVTQADVPTLRAVIAGPAGSMPLTS